MNLSVMKKILFVLLLLAVCSDLSAQRRYRRKYRTTWNNSMEKFEVIGGTGFTQFLGELGGADDIGTNFLADFDFDALRPNLNLGARYRFNEFIAVRLNFTYGWIKGSDQYTDDPARRNRNLSFRSPLVEWGGVAEFYFLPDVPAKNRYRSRGLYGRKGRPVLGYISSGVCGFWFDPTADNSSGTATRLQPLGTEGQYFLPTRSPYSLVELAIPVNVGFIFKINQSFAIEVEMGYRKTFTDYMDDVSMTYVDPAGLTTADAHYFSYGTALSNSDPGNPNAIPGANNPGQQRGDPTDYDSYMFLHVGVSWKPFSGKQSLPKYR
jgi:hypothetical protein